MSRTVPRGSGAGGAPNGETRTARSGRRRRNARPKAEAASAVPGASRSSSQASSAGRSKSAAFMRCASRFRAAIPSGSAPDPALRSLLHARAGSDAALPVLDDGADPLPPALVTIARRPGIERPGLGGRVLLDGRNRHGRTARTHGRCRCGRRGRGRRGGWCRCCRRRGRVGLRAAEPCQGERERHHRAGCPVLSRRHRADSTVRVPVRASDRASPAPPRARDQRVAGRCR